MSDQKLQQAVLVVDDEPDILEVMCMALEKEYFVSKANSVHYAKQLLGEKKFDLVITDMVMPDSSGGDLVSFIAQFHPKVAILIVTGIEDGLTQLKDIGEFEVLSKPFRRKELLEKVKSLIAA